MRQRWLAPLVALPFFAVSSVATGDQPKLEAKPAIQPDKPAEEATTSVSPTAAARDWYGAWIIGADVAFASVVTVGALVHRAGHEGTGNLIIGGGGIALAVGAPLVHTLHGRPLTGVGSFFLRPGCAIGSVIVVALATVPSKSDPGPYLPYAATLGFAIGTGLDAALLAWRPTDPKPGPNVTLLPWVDGQRVGASIGGVF